MYHWPFPASYSHCPRQEAPAASALPLYALLLNGNNKIPVHHVFPLRDNYSDEADRKPRSLFIYQINSRFHILYFGIPEFSRAFDLFPWS